ITAGTAIAAPAPDERIDDDPRANGDAGVRPDGLHDAGGLVTEHDRVSNTGVLPGIDREIGVTDRGRRDAHERLSGRRRARRLLHESEASRRLENGRAGGRLPMTTVISSTGKFEMISVRSGCTISISSMRTPHSYFLPCCVSSANTMPGLISSG